MKYETTLIEQTIKGQAHNYLKKNDFNNQHMSHPNKSHCLSFQTQQLKVL